LFQLYRVTWWTRHSIPEPELTDDEEEEVENPNAMKVEEPGESKNMCNVVVEVVVH